MLLLLLGTLLSAMRVPLSRREARLLALVRTTVAALRIDGLRVAVAGGWVRDKAMRADRPPLRDDAGEIDLVVLGPLSGERFAQGLAVQAQREVQREEEGLWGGEEGAGDSGARRRRHAGPKGSGRVRGAVAVVRANPEQSKHLETATLRLLGFDIDVAQARSEVYARGSRIPTAVRAASLEEDARRRDFTVNAMYLLADDVVEENGRADVAVTDGTGLGLRHLDERILATPDAPHSTLDDDPLRAIRAARFAARFAMRLDAPLSEAMRAQHVKRALVDKVSRERFRLEMEKALDADAPPDAFYAILADHGLLGTVLPREQLGVASDDDHAVLLDRGRAALRAAAFPADDAEPTEDVGADEESAEVMEARFAAACKRRQARLDVHMGRTMALLLSGHVEADGSLVPGTRGEQAFFARPPVTRFGRGETPFFTPASYARAAEHCAVHRMLMRDVKCSRRVAFLATRHLSAAEWLAAIGRQGLPPAAVAMWTRLVDTSWPTALAVARAIHETQGIGSAHVDSVVALLTQPSAADAQQPLGDALVAAAPLVSGRDVLAALPHLRGNEIGQAMHVALEHQLAAHVQGSSVDKAELLTIL